MNEIQYSVVIPTRNRPKLLNDLIQQIDMENKNLVEIIIIDSSDHVNQTINSKNLKIKYTYTRIKSAAAQRNIGIEKVSQISKFVFFLDDDVQIKKNYFESLIRSIIQSNSIGASGIAINLNKSNKRTMPTGIVGLYKRIFLLDSKEDGKLLKSGVNIPCRSDSQPKSSTTEVEWLIGCAAWRTSILKKLRFEESFTGQSLGEDLLFSNKAKFFGKIIVDRDVIINHKESESERPNQHDFYKMWILNRYVISNQLRLSPMNLAFHWANFGTLILSLFKKHKNYRVNIKIIKGIANGYKQIFRK